MTTSREFGDDVGQWGSERSTGGNAARPSRALRDHKAPPARNLSPNRPPDVDAQEEERPIPGALLYKVNDVVGLLNVSRSVVFDLLRVGRLRSVRQGRSRLIPAAAIRDYVALLEREADVA